MKMTQHPKQLQEDMNGSESDNLIPNVGEGDAIERKIAGSELQQSTTKPDSFIVNVDRFSHLIDKDLNANSRIALQRSLSRKGSNRGIEKKIAIDDRGGNTTSSPRATLHESAMPEVAMGASDHAASQLQSHVHPHHHQITIPNGNSATCDMKLSGKRFGFRRSSQTSIIDPRRILFFFATLSCMGTVVLIYFTLSIGKPNNGGNENGLN